MKKSIILLLFVAFVSTSYAQYWKNSVEGEGPIVTKTLNLDNFTSFGMGVSGNVYFKQGNRQSVTVEGQQNIIDLLSTEVNDQHWKIKFDRNVRNLKGFKVYITIPELTGIGLSGSGDIIGENRFSNLGNVNLKLSGSGNINVDLDASDIRSQISGSGNINLAGSSRNHTAQISGSGNINGGDFSTNDCEVRISGSGNVKMDIRDSLYAAISGSGDVRYSGNPSVKKRISGSGRVYGR